MRRGKIFLFILLVSSFFIFLNGASSKVLISRVRVSGAATSTDEFVELYNFSSSTECLWNWSLKKITSSGGIYNLVSSFPSTTILNPFSYYLITHADYSGTSPDLLYTNENYSLANNNSLVLLDASDNSVDQIFWGNVSATVGLSLQNPEPGEAFVRLPNDEAGNYLDSDDTSLDFFLLSDPPFNSTSPSRPLWSAPTTTEPEQLPTSTPNIEAGAGYDPDLWSYLKINEIHPNPETGDEWVELFNTTSTGFNLDGGVICDDREENCEIGKLNGFVESRGFFTFFLTSSKLNNDGDSVILKNPEGLNLDQFSYGSGKLPQKGQSIARVIDGIDTDNDSDWSVTLSLTPGQPNSISLPPPTIYAGAVLQETGSTSETKFRIQNPQNQKGNTGFHRLEPQRSFNYKSQFFHLF